MFTIKYYKYARFRRESGCARAFSRGYSISMAI